MYKRILCTQRPHKYTFILLSENCVMFDGLNDKDMGFEAIRIWRWPYHNIWSWWRDCVCGYSCSWRDDGIDGFAGYRLHSLNGRSRKCSLHHNRYPKRSRRLRTATLESRAPTRWERRHHTFERLNNHIRHSRSPNRVSLNRRRAHSPQSRQRICLR